MGARLVIHPSMSCEILGFERLLDIAKMPRIRPK